MKAEHYKMAHETEHRYVFLWCRCFLSHSVLHECSEPYLYLKMYKNLLHTSLQAKGRETLTPTQLQNPGPTVYPVCKMCWGNGGAEIVGITKNIWVHDI